VFLKQDKIRQDKNQFTVTDTGFDPAKILRDNEKNKQHNSES